MGNFIYYEDLDDYEKQYNKSKGFDVAYNTLNELEDTIKTMVEHGYSSKDGTTLYTSTGYDSEFGVRAKVLLDEIEEYKQKIKHIAGDDNG